MSELRSFIELANYYRHFIVGYSGKAAPLTNLLKKDRPWTWSNTCHQAFKGLKLVVASNPVLALLDLTKTFEVQTNAFDYALRGVLMQDNHHVAFESRKLSETERRYTAQEKELLVVVHCL